MDAKSITQAATKALQARGLEYDKPAGERSMQHTVDIFNAITSNRYRMAEADGWKFMIALKLARIQSRANHLDSHVDLAAYAALLGECCTNGNSPD